ncbi:neuronal pentraxin-1 isoform X2 [Syngnathoides biaculeatus]|uniref:neuronal pentraxin-1 isoform X2 n=1 Tax=Syngnathoides biaculeatus TaxID=300417 RepID=UPI002ADD5544|nr:neuronal pentraxin-1 isoform X2 [Syngnathoides biaculeatus]
METMRKICDPFLVLLSLLLLPASSTSDSNDFHTAQPRFVCTPIPADADPACVPTAGPGSTGAAHYQSEPPAGWWGASDEAKTTILHLRENLVRQKETILDQRETIRELTAKLALCEAFARSPHDHVGAASDHAYHDNQSGNLIPDSLDSDGAPGAKHREKDVVKHVSSGDVTSSPGQMERMLQALKERLSNLQKRNSSLTYSSSLRELLQRKIETLEEQLHPHDHQHLNDRTDDAGDRGGNRTEAFDEHTDGSHRGGDPGGHQNNEAGGQGYLPRGGYHGNKLETIFNQLHLTGPKRKNNPDAFQLSFPMRSNYMYARVKRALPQEIFALTLCLRLKAGVGPTMGTPFSYSAPGQANEVVLIQWGGNPVELLIDDKAVSVPVTLSDGKWHHVCVTWSTRDGHWESYQDGDLRGSGTDLAPWHPIRAGGVFILGQEQDTLGGRFDATQSFVGELADVQMWSSVLSEAEIQGLASCGSHLAGDVISWSDSDVELHGGVVRHAFEPCH